MPCVGVAVVPIFPGFSSFAFKSSFNSRNPLISHGTRMECPELSVARRLFPFKERTKLGAGMASKSLNLLAQLPFVVNVGECWRDCKGRGLVVCRLQPGSCIGPICHREGAGRAAAHDL